MGGTLIIYLYILLCLIVIRSEKQIERRKNKVIKVTKKELIKAEFYNDTKLTLKGLAKKYKTSYRNVCNIHAKFLTLIFQRYILQYRKSL